MWFSPPPISWLCLTYAFAVINYSPALSVSVFVCWNRSLCSTFFLVNCLHFQQSCNYFTKWWTSTLWSSTNGSLFHPGVDIFIGFYFQLFPWVSWCSFDLASEEIHMKVFFCRFIFSSTRPLVDAGWFFRGSTFQHSSSYFQTIDTTCLKSTFQAFCFLFFISPALPP